MKLWIKTKLIFWVCILSLHESSQAQRFLNLDFEYAQFFVLPAYWGDVVDPTNAFREWTVQGWCLYNNLTLGTPAVDLIGPVFPNGGAGQNSSLSHQAEAIIARSLSIEALLPELVAASAGMDAAQS